MKKLELKKEQLSELTTSDLAEVHGGYKVAGIVNTIKDTECGWNCATTYPVNQCLLSILCILD